MKYGTGTIKLVTVNIKRSVFVFTCLAYVKKNKIKK